jgi:hypothetical protein
MIKQLEYINRIQFVTQFIRISQYFPYFCIEITIPQIINCMSAG